jgi:hypothetical protein
MKLFMQGKRIKKSGLPNKSTKSYESLMRLP